MRHTPRLQKTSRIGIHRRLLSRRRYGVVREQERAHAAEGDEVDGPESAESFAHVETTSYGLIDR